MNKYEIIFESLQSKVESGELNVEEAELINSIAYEKYSDDYTEYEEVVEESTRLAKEIDKRQTDLTSQIKRLKDHLGHIKKLAKTTTDPKKKEELENEIDDVMDLIQKLSSDKSSMDSRNTIKYGREFGPTASSIKKEQDKRNAEYYAIRSAIDNTGKENSRLRQEKNLIKRLSNQKRIHENKDKISNLEDRLIEHSILQSVENMRENKKLRQGLQDGHEKKTNQRKDDVKTSFRRTKHHTHQTNSILDNK